MTASNSIQYSLGKSIGSQNKRQENNFSPGFNPAFNPTFNTAAIEMPANPEYEARNNFPSSFQTNTYGSNNHMTPSSNLPYSLIPGIWQQNLMETKMEESLAKQEVGCISKSYNKVNNRYLVHIF